MEYRCHWYALNGQRCTTPATVTRLAHRRTYCARHFNKLKQNATPAAGHSTVRGGRLPGSGARQEQSTLPDDGGPGASLSRDQTSSPAPAYKADTPPG